jgi:DNA replication protein DnaC
MIEETLRKLHDMKLFSMADKLKELSGSDACEKLSYAEVLACLVDVEYDRRRNNHMARLLRDARLKLPQACMEDIDYSSKRNLKKDSFRDLMGCSFIKHQQNILISGPTGAGKTYLASALGNLACRNGFSTRYFRSSMFLEQVTADKRIGNYLKTIAKYGKTKLLIIDDIGPDIFTAEQRNIFMEIIEERYLTASTIITSQLPFEQWYALFDEPTTADAVCDRMFHNAIKINVKGDSMRKNKQLPGT